MNGSMKKWMVGASVAASLVGAIYVTAPSVEAQHTLIDTTEIDIAMDGNTFFFEGDTTPSGVPADGTPFVIEGYIYPGGTLQRNGLLSGVNPDGSPQFPKLVLGTWICRGWHLQPGDATTGPGVVTTQYFEFDPDRAGKHALTTEGIEMAGFGEKTRRIITGGTGMFLGARGEHKQVLVGGGLNASGGFNLMAQLDVAE